MEEKIPMSFFQFEGGENVYEVVDEQARTDNLEQDNAIEQVSEQIVQLRQDTAEAIAAVAEELTQEIDTAEANLQQKFDGEFAEAKVELKQYTDDSVAGAVKDAEDAAEAAIAAASIFERDVTNIEQAARGTIMDVSVNADISYSKPAPQNTLPYAVVDSLGGMTTVVGSALVDHAPAAVVGVDTLNVAALVQKYFPDGMRSAGAVYDELDFENGVAIKRIGVVDLGTINWQAIDYRYNSRGIDSTIKRVESSSVLVNATCAKYTVITNDDSTRRVVGIASAPSGTIYIYDTAYDPATVPAAEFKQSLAGVMLNYELAEPVVTLIEESISPAVRVVAGGNVTVQNDKGGSVGLPSRIAFSVKKSGGSGGVQLDPTLTDNTKAAPAGMVGAIKDDKADLSLLGGLKFQRITQEDYDLLDTKDADTLYVIVG